MCCQQLEGVEELLDLPREKFKIVEAANAKDAVRSKGELARLQKEFYLSRHLTAAAKSYLTGLHNAFDVIAANFSFVESESTTL